MKTLKSIALVLIGILVFEGYLYFILVISLRQYSFIEITGYLISLVFFAEMYNLAFKK